MFWSLVLFLFLSWWFGGAMVRGKPEFRQRLSFEKACLMIVLNRLLSILEHHITWPFALYHSV